MTNLEPLNISIRIYFLNLRIEIIVECATQRTIDNCTRFWLMLFGRDCPDVPASIGRKKPATGTRHQTSILNRNDMGTIG